MQDSHISQILASQHSSTMQHYKKRRQQQRRQHCSSTSSGQRWQQHYRQQCRLDDSTLDMFYCQICLKVQMMAGPDVSLLLTGLIYSSQVR